MLPGPAIARLPDGGFRSEPDYKLSAVNLKLLATDIYIS